MAEKIKRLVVNIKVTVGSGSGRDKQNQIGNLLAARQAGVVIPDSAILDAMDMDADALRQQAIIEQREKMMAQQPGPPPMAAQAAPQAAPPPPQIPPQAA